MGQDHLATFTDQSISPDVALSGDVNKAYTAKFEPMLSKVINVFDGIQGKHPLSIEAGGTMDPITQSSVSLAMNTEKGVVSGVGNLFWQNIRWRPSPNVPINETGITDIKLHSFKTPPAKLNFNVHVAFAKEMELSGSLGNLHRVSPEEPVHALLWGISDAIDRNAKPNEMRAWEELLLNVPFVFERFSNADAIVKRSIDLREELTTQLDAIKRTPFARFLEIVNIRQEMERTKGKVTTDMLFNFFKTVTFSKKSEKISKNLLENVNAVWNKWKTDPSTMQIVQEANTLYGNESPFSGILQMYLLCNEAGKDTKLMKWVFASAFDAYRSGAASRDDMNAHKLQDGKRVDVVDVFVFKKALLSELLGDELQRLHLPVNQVKLLQKYYESHDTYRNACGFNDPAAAKFDKTISLAWQTEMTKATMKYNQLIEMTIYSCHFDGVLRQCLKNSKSAEDTLRYGSLGIEMQKVHDVMEDAGDGSRGEAADGDADADVDGGHVFEGDEEADSKARWRAYATRLVKTRVTLIVAPNSEKRFIDLLRDAGINSAKYEKDEYQGIIYNSKTEGEAKSNPATRTPNHRTAYMQKAISSCLRAIAGPRSDEDSDQVSVSPDRMYFFLDAFKHGHSTGFLNSFSIDDRKLDKDSTIYYITYEWSSLQARRLHVHDDSPVDTVEFMHVVTEGPLHLPPKQRLTNDTSSNQCNFIGPVVTEDVNESWQLTYYDKKNLLGDARAPNGGPAPGKAEPARRHDADLELVAYHGNGYLFYSELVHSFGLTSIVHLTPLDDKCGLAAIAHKASYIGVCYTEEHATRLMDRLIDLTYNALFDPHMDGIYEPSAVADMTPPDEDDDDKPKSKPKGDGEKTTDLDGKGNPGTAKPKKEPKKKAKRKPTKPTVEDGDAAATALENLLNGLDDPGQDAELDGLGESA
ncbi:unnamed protein product [Prorocentrum cordatum]|uniref:Uncharacterized protein n=1 Tax=Prorocentrum cordatum TaxID=2364126 RepID=A0ABN9SBW7_9DINO|nr:unnamed protein product [Polarella glacialis]